MDCVLPTQPVVCCIGCVARKLQPSALVVAVAMYRTRCIRPRSLLLLSLQSVVLTGESLARRRVLRAGQFQSRIMASTPKIATMEQPIRQQSMARVQSTHPEWLRNMLPWTLAATSGQIGSKLRSERRHELAQIDGPARTPPGRTRIEWSGSGATRFLQAHGNKRGETCGVTRRLCPGLALRKVEEAVRSQHTVCYPMGCACD